MWIKIKKSWEFFSGLNPKILILFIKIFETFKSAKKKDK